MRESGSSPRRKLGIKRIDESEENSENNLLQKTGQIDDFDDEEDDFMQLKR